MTHLQKTLSAMQIDKERIENEYRKLGTSKNKTQIQRKQELEFDIEVLNKNIHSIKQKLRELHAFWEFILISLIRLLTFTFIHSLLDDYVGSTLDL